MVEAFESVLLAAFLRGAPPNALRLWNTAFENDPSAFQTPSSGPSFARGTVGEYGVTVSAQPGRVDITFTGTEPGTAQMTPPALGNLRETLDFALSALPKTIPMLEVMRLAVVIQGHTATKDSAEAIELIKTWLPGIPTPDGATEITYQVVVPKKSELVPGRELTQICRWETVRFQTLEIQLGAAGLPASREGSMAAHRYIDVYSKDPELLDAANALSAAKEIASVALNLANGGINDLH
jgi:hypothetical protein